MADITHGTWIKDGKAIDAVYQNGKQVYGRNLLLDSDFLKSPSTWVQEGATLDNSGSFAKLTGIRTTPFGRIYEKVNVFDKIPVQSAYSISFVAYSDTSGVTAGVGPFNNSNSFVLNTVPTKYEISSTKATTDSNAFSITVPNGSVIYIKEIKVNLGGLAMPYSPAPEDVLN